MSDYDRFQLIEDLCEQIKTSYKIFERQLNHTLNNNYNQNSSQCLINELTKQQLVFTECLGECQRDAKKLEKEEEENRKDNGSINSIEQEKEEQSDDIQFYSKNQKPRKQICIDKQSMKQEHENASQQLMSVYKNLGFQMFGTGGRYQNIVSKKYM